MFRMLYHGNIFLLSRSNKNLITCQKIIIFVWHKKLIPFFCITKFLYSVFTLRIGSMLIFFLVVLETKKLLNHLLPLCLIYRSRKSLQNACYALKSVDELYSNFLLFHVKLTKSRGTTIWKPRNWHLGMGLGIAIRIWM